MQPIIEVKNLVKKYGTVEAVRDLSFTVHEGEVFGLLGPNGAGKSTTLEIIETLREKTSGEVWVNGFNLDTQASEIKNNNWSTTAEFRVLPRTELDGTHPPVFRFVQQGGGAA